MAFYAICPDRGCRFSISYDPKKKDPGTFCHKCGGKLIFSCPKCQTRFQSKDQKFCGACGDSIIPEPDISPVDLEKYKS